MFAGFHRIQAMSRSCQRYARCDKAASAVEFAIIAAPFVALLIAILQTALVFFASRVLDETAEQASRYIFTGQAQSAGMTQSQFANYLCQKSSSLFTCGNFMINVQNSSSFGSADTSTPTLTFDSSGAVTNQWAWSPGSPGDIVVVQVMYQWPVMLGPLGFNLANLPNGNRLLVSTVAFKSEPY